VGVITLKCGSYRSHGLKSSVHVPCDPPRIPSLGQDLLKDQSISDNSVGICMLDMQFGFNQLGPSWACWHWPVRQDSMWLTIL